MTLKSFYSSEKTFAWNPSFKKLYQKEIKESIENVHVEKLDNKISETSNITNFLPYGVFNVNKPGQLRVIYDVSETY